MKSQSPTVRWALLAGLATLLLAVVTVGQHAYAAGIADTRHNLGSQVNGIANRNQTAAAPNGTAEICVFCHTPHHSATPNPAADQPPLWNKNLPTTATYTLYNTATSSSLDGEVLAVGSVSVACLSCHDGTQAMDNIINAPGSGGLTADGGGVNGLAYTWTGTTVNTTTGILSAGGPGLIGADLTNDHPIGVEYCGGGISGTTGVTGCKDADFKGGGTNSGLATTTINSTQVWWVDTTGGTANREKTDMILYTRAFTAGSGPSVECASCHDPHSATNPTFLRVSNDGSGVCLSCHVK